MLSLKALMGVGRGSEFTVGSESAHLWITSSSHRWLVLRSSGGELCFRRVEVIEGGTRLSFNDDLRGTRLVAEEKAANRSL